MRGRFGASPERDSSDRGHTCRPGGWPDSQPPLMQYRAAHPTEWTQSSKLRRHQTQAATALCVVCRKVRVPRRRTLFGSVESMCHRQRQPDLPCAQSKMASIVALQYWCVSVAAERRVFPHRPFRCHGTFDLISPVAIGCPLKSLHCAVYDAHLESAVEALQSL